MADAAQPRPAEVIQKELAKVLKEMERVYNTKDLWDEFWGAWDDDLQDLARDLELELKGMSEHMHFSSEERADILQQIPMRKRRASAPAVLSPPTSPVAEGAEGNEQK